MTGSLASSSGAFSINAAATGPERWASRPASVGNASKIAKRDDARRTANHAVVWGSCSTSGSAPLRNAARSSSLPGFASSVTNRPTATNVCSFAAWWVDSARPSRSRRNPRTPPHRGVRGCSRGLAGRELRAGHWGREVRGWCVGCVADHRAVDVNSGRTVGLGLPRGGIHARQQVWPRGREVEHLVLVDLPGVQTLLDGLVGPQPQLRVPQRAVGVRVPRICPGLASDASSLAWPSSTRCWKPWACELLAPVWPLMNPNRRSRAEPRKSSPPLNDASLSAGTYVERSSTAVSGWPASVLR